MITSKKTNIEKLQNKITHLKLDAFLITDPNDLVYLTGIDLSGGYWAVITRKNACLITSKMLFLQLRKLSPEIKVIESKNTVLELKNILKTMKIKRIGFDSQKMMHAVVKNLQKKVNNVIWHPLQNIIEEFRQVKTPEEIEEIRKACKITMNVFKNIRSYIRPGITEKHISNRIMELFYRNNASPAFLPIVASGENTSYPHHLSSDRIIRKNDTLTIDLGAKYNNYCSDLTRTIFLGKITNLYNKINKIVNNAQKSALFVVKPGIKASFIDKIARKIIASKGYGKFFLHGTGHGVGLDIHEAPGISPKSTVVLKSGMIITIEPGIYLKDKFGIRIEDTVLVTECGYELLTI